MTKTDLGVKIQFFENGFCQWKFWPTGAGSNSTWSTSGSKLTVTDVFNATYSCDGKKLKLSNADPQHADGWEGTYYKINKF